MDPLPPGSCKALQPWLEHSGVKAQAAADDSSSPRSIWTYRASVMELKEVITELQVWQHHYICVPLISKSPSAPVAQRPLVFSVQVEQPPNLVKGGKRKAAECDHVTP